VGAGSWYGNRLEYITAFYNALAVKDRRLTAYV